jgi:thioredoxin reductase
VQSLHVTRLDVIVVGGGPAGLSAALMLGRCRRRVMVCDAQTPRNARSRALHGYLTRDGLSPEDLLAAGRAELRAYGVIYRHARVTRIAPDPEGFTLALETGAPVGCRKVLIATGVTDHLPAIDGFEACYGRTVFHCPYCDGWEWSERRLAVYGRGQSGAGLSLSLQTWSRDIVLVTDGPSRLTAPTRARLEAQAIRTIETRLHALEHDAGAVHHLRFVSGERFERDAVFFAAGQHQQARFAADLGCEVNRRGTIRTDRFGQTCVPGVYVIGDASRDAQFIVVAAAEGAKAAVAINKQFQAESGLVLQTA